MITLETHLKMSKMTFQIITVTERVKDGKEEVIFKCHCFELLIHTFTKRLNSFDNP